MCCGINLSTIAAIAVVADSAVGNSVVGGNIQHCATGILVTRGSVTAIDGVGFEEQTGYDIDIASTAADGVAVVGIRTESPNFFRAITTKPVTLTANTQGSSPVVFAYLDGCPASIEGCHADGGVISVRNGARVSILNYSTNNLTSAWLDAPAATLWFTPTNPIQGTIELENITYAQASGTPVHTFKQRIYTTNGTSLTTMNYQVGP